MDATNNGGYKPPGQIRGKDLAGAIKVMPMGLDAAIKKRVSGEFKSERGATVSFSSAEQGSTVKKETKQLQSFQEVSEVSEVQSIGTPFQQAGFKAAPLQENLVSRQESAGFAQMSSSQQSSSQHIASSSVTQKSMMSSSSSTSKS